MDPLLECLLHGSSIGVFTTWILYWSVYYMDPLLECLLHGSSIGVFTTWILYWSVALSDVKYDLEGDLEGDTIACGSDIRYAE